MTMLNPTQASGQGKESPHLGGPLCLILHTHQIKWIQANIASKEGLRGKNYVRNEEANKCREIAES